jgi:predicted 2-oxoglutarate/Fe(II)-dependent dioxygenase YbiX
LTYNPNGELATEVGKIYKMNSEVLHEVTEVTKGTRYSFVYFITYKELGLEMSLF